MQWRLILTLALMVVVVLFSLANAAVVPFHYFIGMEAKVSLALIMIISALVGAIAGVVASLGSQLRLRQKIHEQEQQLRELGRDKAALADDLKTERQAPRRPRRISEE